MISTHRRSLLVALQLAALAHFVACGASSTFAVGGSVSGYEGTGLSLQNGDEVLTLEKGATGFAFATRVAANGTFAVQVLTQPTGPSQTCTLTNGSGTVTNADVTTLALKCVTNTYALIGTVEGYSGSGLVLQNGSETLSIATGVTSFVFPTRLASGASYAVTATTQPGNPSQTCTVTDGAGVVAGADVNVRVVCARTTYALGGTITGYSGSGLSLANGGETLAVAAGATTFAFTTQVASGSTYAVSVAAQPTSPSQTCTVSSGTGTVTTGAVNSVHITCSTNTYALSGTLTGYTGAGLTLINGAETLTIAANASSFVFATSVASGSAFDVTVGTQPSTPSQTCVVTAGTGTVAGADVTTIQVACTTNTYAVGGSIAGYTGSGLTLTTGTQTSAVPMGATSFAFTTPIASGTSYTVSVATQPSEQTCTVSNGSGTVAASAVTVQVQCVTNTYPLAVTVTGVTKPGLVLQNNGADDLPIAAATNGLASATFTTQLASGATWAVTIKTQPSGGVCTLSGATGTVGSSAPPAVTVSCALGESFVFTPGTDNLPGTAGNDLFTGVIGGGAVTGTYSVGDAADGGGGTDTLFLEHTGAAGALPAASISNIEVLTVHPTVNLNSSDLSNLRDLTQFNLERPTATATVTSAPAGVTFGLFGDGVTLFPGSFNLGLASTATVATLTLDGGVRSNGGTNVFLTGAGVTSTVINSIGAPNSLSTASTAGVIVMPATSQQLTINAAADLTCAISSTQTTSLTTTGSAVIDVRGITYGFALNNQIVTIDASRMTAGGLLVQGGNSNAIKFFGGPGDDSFGLGTVLASGQLDGGAGVDTVRTNNATFISAATGPRISNFEIVDIAANITVDLAHLASTNTLTGLRLGGASNVVNNVPTNVANNVTIYASGSPNLNLIGATTPGQLDTVRIDANDGRAAVSTINIGAPGFTGVETLIVNTTDNVVISGFNNMTSLKNVTVIGAGTISATTGAIAVQPGATIDASAATGAVTFNATGSTGNGWTVRGSSGVNVITGGSAPLVVDLSASIARADTVAFTSATGSTLTALQSLTGFTNAATTGDGLDVINTASLVANVASGASTGVTNLTAGIATGVVTFAGSAAATATLLDKVNAAAFLAGTTQYGAVAFEHAGRTYVFEQGDTTATYAPGVDLLVELTGVTGVTALSTTASAANTVWVR